MLQVLLRVFHHQKKLLPRLPFGCSHFSL
jgi:hypothetical protein